MKTGAHGKALYFVNQALKTARRNGAAKHEAGALRVKAGIFQGNRPKMAHACLERASQLSTEIGARCLQQKIRKVMVSLENP
ncbi:MAG: hypothetical protein GY846_09245 [Deltaproteobacteria bacterium]|nr:hypothetical protein [Deltaproteobacteria bacterium]